MNSTMRYAQTGLCLSLALAGAELSQAQTTDTFESGTNWWWYLDGGNASLVVQNQRLEYIVVAPTANDSMRVVPGAGANFATWAPFSSSNHELVGYVDANWSAQVDVHYSSGLPENSQAESASIGFHVVKYQNQPYSDALMALAFSPTVSAGLGTYSGHWTSPTTQVLADYTFRFSYVAATHTLTGSIYASDGVTLKLQTALDVTAASGTSAESGLGMSSDFGGPAFGFMLTANSENVAVDSGELYFDNFSYSGLSDALYSQTAVPEPSTYAVWAGVVAIGGAIVVRRRRKGAV